MKVRLFSAAVVCVLTAVPALAADVAGKWNGQVPAAQGQAESAITFIFKVDGDNLTGTLNNSQQPGDVELKEGKVTGDDITFSLTRNIGGTDTKVVWKGKIAGDEIKFTRSVAGAAGPGGAATEITAKRAKP
jgi:opacity protein-like surface antigen